MQRDGTRRTAGINPNKYQQSIEGTAFENAYQALTLGN